MKNSFKVLGALVAMFLAAIAQAEISQERIDELLRAELSAKMATVFGMRVYLGYLKDGATEHEQYLHDEQTALEINEIYNSAKTSAVEYLLLKGRYQIEFDEYLFQEIDLQQAFDNVEQEFDALSSEIQSIKSVIHQE